MKSKKEQYPPKMPFPVPMYRFDQKNDIYKRNRWDKKIPDNSRSYYEGIKYLKKVGYRKTDYALRNATWSFEHNFALGNSRSNFGAYAWEGFADKLKGFVETGGPVLESPEEMSRIIKKVARFLGADLVGLCKLHPNWVYSHEFNLVNLEHYPIEVPAECNNVVVVGVETDYETIRSSPTGIAGAATGLGYSKMAFVANMIAMFIRGLGYRALPSGNDTALSVPLAMAAGLGEKSRMGLLITEKYGPRVRICKVFTDLPVQYDAYRPFGVVEFCKTCKKCADNCPGKAIPSGDMTMEGPSISNHSGVLKWYIDAEKCYSFWTSNRMDCINCVRVCPFNKKQGIIHEAVRAIIRQTTLFNRLLVRMDTLFGYDRHISAKKFWES